MNKKGFTLVELLGVVVILAMIMLIAIPNIMSLVERTKKDGYIGDAKKMVYLVKSEIKKGRVDKPSAEQTKKITLKDLLTKDLEKDKDGYTYDLNKSYVYITRENGNLVYYVQLVSDKGKTYRGIKLVNVEDLSYEDRYEKYYENTDIIDLEPQDMNANKKYKIGIALNNIIASATKLTIKYGQTVTVNIEPVNGYYLEKVSCTNGYTTNAEIGVTALGSQTVTISNNSHDYPSTCTFTGKKITYSAALSLVDTQASKENVSLKFGGSGVVDITPKKGYFLASASCTNGYTTNAEVGLQYTGKQVVTIANNNVKNLSTCTFKSLPAYPIVSGGSTSWTTGSRTFRITRPLPSSEITRYEYYVSNSNSKPGDNVAATGNFTSEEVTISRTGKYAYFRIIYANGIISHWSEAKDLYVDRDALAAPTVIGGGTTWKLSRTFMITGPLPTSGISRYEYYVSNSNTKPAKTQAATVSLLTPTMNIVTEGQYAFFRVVNNAGVTSEWTDAKNLYVDPNTYTITYNLNGGEQGTGAKTRFDVETTFNLPTPIKPGYNFGGWYENSSFGGNRINSIPLETRGNKTYYAKWTVTTYAIAYELNGGTQAANQKTSYTIETPTFNLLSPSRTGYTFNGWYNGTGDGKTTQIVKGTIGDKFFYASWTAHKYTIKFHANGGSGSMSNQLFTYDETKPLTGNAFTRTGYIFLGWATSSTATSPTYGDKQSITNLTTTNGAVINLYAVWQRITSKMLDYENTNYTTCKNAECAINELYSKFK